MASKIDIYNMALQNIGMKKIFDLTTDSPRLRALDSYWEQALEDTYSELAWSFATVKQQFAQVTLSTSERVPGWDYFYAYPPKAAIVHSVFNEANVTYKDEQEFEVAFIPSLNKRVVCSNEANAYQEYSYKISDTTLFSPKFVVALSFKLSAYIAPGLTTDEQISSRMQASADIIIQEAKRLNAKEKIKRPEQTSKILNSRS